MKIDRFVEQSPPVIVVGMHRSGTSAVSRLLHAAGINMGRRQDANAESLFFLRINHWLFSQCGASWANVDQIPELLAEHIDVLEPIVRRRVGSVASIEHFGVRRDPGPWGFKDPRASMLHPLYQRLFPACKFVVVSRHGVDVAASLRERSLASRALVGDESTVPLFGIRQPRSHRLQNALVASDLARNFALWESYQRSQADLEAQAGQDRVHRIRFEDLVRDPPVQLRSLSNFVGTQVADNGLIAQRAFAFEESPELVAFARENAASLTMHGYAGDV